MAPLKVFNHFFFKHQKLPHNLVNYFESLRLSSSTALTEPEPLTTHEKKLLKVAIMGRPNAGKSTLINKILKLNLCGVSHKSHTTRVPFKTSFTENDTQIVFMDTPGVVTKKEISRFDLPSTFQQAFDQSVINAVDIIGIIHEVRVPRKPSDLFKFPLSLTQRIDDLSKSKPLFLILNKVDLITDKEMLSAAMDIFERPTDDVNRPNVLQNFSQIFFTSAIQNAGVREIMDYLVQQAKPGQWLFEADQPYKAPLKTVILELLRARFLENFPHTIPYSCKYEIEYLKENDLGEIICVSLVTCRYARNAAFIITKKKNNLRLLCKELESDLFKILGKVFKLRIIVQAPNK